MRQHRGEEGVSEVVGVMLLVGVTVLAVAIVAVALLSGSPPDEIPHTVIIAGINETGSLVLAHEGGDPLREGEYRIYVENESGFVDGTGDFTEPAGGVWSIGGTLAYNGTGTPERVVVTAVSGGSETILAEPVFVGGGEGAAGFSPDPVEPGVTPVATGTPGSGSDGDASPIQIVSPGEGQNLIFFSNSTTIMKADVTSLDVDRVDFILYPFNQSHSKPNHKEVLKRDVPGSNGSYVWNDISTKGDSGLAEIPNGDKVVMIAVAYKGEQVVGVVARVATVSK